MKEWLRQKSRTIIGIGITLIIALGGIGLFAGAVHTDYKRQQGDSFHVWLPQVYEETEEPEAERLHAESEAASEAALESEVIATVPEFTLQARAAALLDADTGRVLYEKNGQDTKAMASTTKIMTCMLALELGNPEDIVTFSENAAAQPDVQMNGCTGERYYLKDLLYSLMLESHNDTAVAIAEHIGGSVEDFAELMNEKAEELGAYQTQFVTPNGLDAEGHYTTACDLGRIACYAIRNPQFLEIIQTPAYTFSELDGKRTVSVVNKDAFLTSYEGAMGIKTGFTGEAGYCFVGAASRGDKTFVSVVLASGWPPHKTYKWQDTKLLMDYGMERYEMQNLISPDYALPELPLRNGAEDKAVPLRIRDSRDLLLQAEEEVRYEARLPEELEAPVREGDIAGMLDIYIDDRLYDSVVIYVGKDARRLCYRDVFLKVVRGYFFVNQG